LVEAARAALEAQAARAGDGGSAKGGVSVAAGLSAEGAGVAVGVDINTGGVGGNGWPGRQRRCWHQWIDKRWKCFHPACRAMAILKWPIPL